MGAMDIGIGCQPLAHWALEPQVPYVLWENELIMFCSGICLEDICPSGVVIMQVTQCCRRQDSLQPKWHSAGCSGQCFYHRRFHGP